jgi:hypothetical protein
MLDGEWLLEFPGTSLSMGGWDPVTNPFRVPRNIYHRSAPVVGAVAIATDDNDRPRMDGQNFGSDFRGGRPITFDLGVRGSSEAEALTLAETVARAWRGDGVRGVPGRYATLSTRNAGRERLVYGRPRRFEQNDTDRKTGLVVIQCDFQTVDDLFYDRTDTGTSLGFVSPPSGGLMSPLVSPLTTTANSSTPGAIVIGGVLPVWPVITINGPIINPTVTVVNEWSLQLLTTILVGQSITIDTRPMARTVTRTDGASFAGALTRTSRMDQTSLPPGSYAIGLAGIDNTGLSSVQFAWRNTYASL